MTDTTQSSPDIADITMQDVRLVCGEGKLENRHILNAVNLIIKRRAEMAVATHDSGIAQAPMRDALENLPEEAIDNALWTLASHLHANIPEHSRPESWSDYSPEQIDRLHKAANAFLAALCSVSSTHGGAK